MDGGIGKLYAHQAELAECAWQGRDAVISTGTSSGKSLGYQLPILTRLAEDQTACARGLCDGGGQSGIGLL